MPPHFKGAVRFTDESLVTLGGFLGMDSAAYGRAKEVVGGVCAALRTTATREEAPMARASRRRGRSEEAEEIPVAEPEERGRGRGSPQGQIRTPSGPDFALKAALGAGVVAAFLAFMGVLLMNRLAGTDATAVMDLGGVQAVRALAAIDMNRWAPEFGTTRLVRARIERGIEDKLEKVKAAGDDRDVELLQEPINEFWRGNASEGAEWRPGVDLFLPKGDPEDLAIDAARNSGFERVQSGDRGALAGMAVLNTSDQAVMKSGDVYMGGAFVSQVGETRISAAQGVRIYEHPTVNRLNQPAGRAIVALFTDKAAGPDIMGTGGVAALLAFMGAFGVAFILCLGPVKALQRLAGEAENLARGDLAGRLTLRGPDIVVATARSVQKLAHLAAEGGGGGAPQIVHQTVAVIPTDEIHAALAPMRSFERPPELEIEATHKACPDSGNDFHDVVNAPGGKVGLFVADIPMRGLQGAMYMAQVRALFRAAAARHDSPAAVLKEVNAGFAIDLPRGVYVTAMYCVVEPESGICKVASAQHLPLVFWKVAKKGSARLQTQGIALGHDAGPVFDKSIEEKAIKLERGDRIVLFSDGAITARNANGATYGEDRFYMVVNREAPKNSAAFVNFVANDVDLFHEGADQLDDFTILTARKVR